MHSPKVMRTGTGKSFFSYGLTFLILPYEVEKNEAENSWNKPILDFTSYHICTRKGEANEVWNYCDTIDLLQITVVPSTFFVKFQTFVSVTWFNQQILSKIDLNYHFTTKKSSNTEYRNILRPRPLKMKTVNVLEQFSQHSKIPSLKSGH